MHKLGQFIESLMDAESMDRPGLVRRSGLSRQHVHDLLTNEKLSRLPAGKTIDGLHRAFPHVTREQFVLTAAVAMGIPVDAELAKPDYSKLTNEALLGILKDRLEGRQSWSGGTSAEDEVAGEVDGEVFPFPTPQQQRPAAAEDPYYGQRKQQDDDEPV